LGSCSDREYGLDERYERKIRKFYEYLKDYPRIMLVTCNVTDVLTRAKELNLYFRRTKEVGEFWKIEAPRGYEEEIAEAEKDVGNESTEYIL
jgi:hypothetical protein